MTSLALFAFLVSLVATLLVRRLALRWHTPYAQDASQRLHVGYVPRLGGLGVFAGWACALAALPLLQRLGMAGNIDLARLALPWWAAALLPAFTGGVLEDLTQRLTVRWRLLLTLVSGLLAWALLGERPTAGALLRLALALAGVTLVLKKPGVAWPWPESQADWLAIAGGFSFALTGVLLRRWRGTPATARTFAMFLGSAIVSAGVALAAQAAHLAAPPALANWAGWLPWALGLTAALLTGNMALQYGTAHLPAQTASLIMLAEVVFASVSSVALGAAALATGTLAGGAMILSAALLAVLMRR